MKLKNTDITITIKTTIATIAMRWGIKDGGTAARLAAKAIWWSGSLTPSQRRSAKRALARLTRLAKDEHTAYCLCRETQRQEWLATFPARN